MSAKKAPISDVRSMNLLLLASVDEEPTDNAALVLLLFCAEAATTRQAIPLKIRQALSHVLEPLTAVARACGGESGTKRCAVFAFLHAFAMHCR